MYLSVWLIRISDEDLKNINKSGRPSNAKFREIDGGGNMGTIEVFHQLHCLVRKKI
jgi:Mycotoxin biosynthesis protein UstYa